MSCPGVTKLVKKLNPDVKDYLNELIEDGSLETQQVHQSYNYPEVIKAGKNWPHFGLFYDYLIRKNIYNLFGKKAMDNRADKCRGAFEKYQQQITDCCPEKVECSDFYDEEGNLLEKHHEVKQGIRCPIRGREIDTLEELLASYKLFQDHENETFDIGLLQDIFQTSMLFKIYFGEPAVQFNSEFINLANIKDILEYVETFNLNNIMINPIVECEYFYGDADLIFHDSVMDFKVCMYDQTKRDRKFREYIYQVIFYALGLFIEKQEERRKFKIYNPLRGVLYVLDIPDLNFPELLELVKDKQFNLE